MTREKITKKGHVVSKNMNEYDDRDSFHEDGDMEMAGNLIRGIRG